MASCQYDIALLIAKLDNLPQAAIHQASDYENLLLRIAQAVFESPVGSISLVENTYLFKENPNKLSVYTLHYPHDIFHETSEHKFYAAYELTVNERFFITTQAKALKLPNDIVYSSYLSTICQKWKSCYEELSQYSPYLVKPPLFLLQDRYQTSFDQLIDPLSTTRFPFTLSDGLSIVTKILGLIKIFESKNLHYSELRPENILVTNNTPFLNQIHQLDKNFIRLPTSEERQSPYYSQLFRRFGFKTHICNIAALMTMLGKLITPSFPSIEILDGINSNNYSTLAGILKGTCNPNDREFSTRLLTKIFLIFCHINNLCRLYQEQFPFALPTPTLASATEKHDTFIKSSPLKVDDIDLCLQEAGKTLTAIRDKFLSSRIASIVTTFQTSQAFSLYPEKFTSRVTQLALQTLYFQQNNFSFVYEGIGFKKKKNALYLYKQLEFIFFASGSYKLAFRACKIKISSDLGVTFKEKVLLEPNFSHSSTELEKFKKRTNLLNEIDKHSKIYHKFNSESCRIAKPPKIFRKYSHPNPSRIDPTTLIFQKSYDSTLLSLIGNDRITLKKGIELLRNTLISLSHLHSENTHHGDVTLANIFVKDGLPFLADLATLKEHYYDPELNKLEKIYIFYSNLYRTHGLKTAVCDLVGVMVCLGALISKRFITRDINDVDNLHPSNLEHRKNFILRLEPTFRPFEKDLKLKLLNVVLDFFEHINCATLLYYDYFYVERESFLIAPLTSSEEHYVKTLFPTADDLIKKLVKFEELLNI